MGSPYIHLDQIRGVILDWDGVIAESRLDFTPIREKYFGGRRVPLLEAAAEMQEPLKTELMNAIRDEEMRGAAFRRGRRRFRFHQPARRTPHPMVRIVAKLPRIHRTCRSKHRFHAAAADFRARSPLRQAGPASADRCGSVHRRAGFSVPRRRRLPLRTARRAARRDALRSREQLFRP